MSSKASPSATVNRSEAHKDLLSTSRKQETVLTSKDILFVIDSVTKQVTANRRVFVEKRMEENRQKLIGITKHLHKLANERRNFRSSDTDGSVDLLMKRQRDALDKQNGIDVDNEDNDSDSLQEDGHDPSVILLGSSIAVKSSVCPIALTKMTKLPPYTTWIFLDRNQRMTEDQSVLGRRRIYYDQNGGEALICSDSEEEIIEEEEEKKDFVGSDDYILRNTIQEVGLSDNVLDLLASRLSKKSCDIKARYEFLIKGEKASEAASNDDVKDASLAVNYYLDKDLDAALDSFDNLFCRRCLVFDCRLHGCSQDLVFQAEKQLPWSCPEEENEPCGPHCFRLVLVPETSTQADSGKKTVPSSDGAGAHVSIKKKSKVGRRAKFYQSETASSTAKIASEGSESEIRLPSSPKKTRIIGKSKRNSKRVAERVLLCMQKKQKKMAPADSDFIGDMKLRSNLRKENDGTGSSQKKVKSPTTGRSKRKELQIQDTLDRSLNMINGSPKKELGHKNICREEKNNSGSWKSFEKGLFEKGLEIFGMNSCLIARNLLNGMKRCSEVFEYMNCSDNKLSRRVGEGANSLVEGCSKNETVGNEVRRRSRFLRRRGKVRRLKYTWKSAGYHSIRKRITEKKDQPCRQYNPCSCQSGCGKQCSCLLNGTCCEKYCGCSKICKNRFRGCHCAKSQCRSRQCPCFAADRECDPDVCRNCWVSCGDGTLGVPSQRGDNYECRNMKLLLKQQQRVLLGKSDVSGWGAFLKSSVGKHEYLGEYTGELISHREADKRGKIYDRENSSFLFNLNDQFVLDAYRKGDKLKFANHSPDPNCYAKVIMVAGDHRVGIFAKERINAGEELFYDYRYEPDRAPAWARKPELSGSKKEDIGPSSGRAKKLA